MKNTIEFTKFTELEKQVIRAWCYEIKSPCEDLDVAMNSAISYWTISADELTQITKIPTKKLRGVLSSLVKKDVFYEDVRQADNFWEDEICFFASNYFYSDNCVNDQKTDCNMDKIYDAIK